MAQKYVTKPGKHGTLYLYRYEYFDPQDPAFPRTSNNVWAYDAEHAAEKIADGFIFEGFDGCEIVADSLRRAVQR